MFKDFPSLHPLAVHFPIVFILIAALFQAVVTWKGDWNQIRWATLLIMAGAFFSGLAAATIFHAHPSADAPKAAMEMFEGHEKYAQFTLWTSGITLLLKAIGFVFKINRRSYDVLVLIAAFSALVFVSITGHHGASLTHIAGVGPMGRYLMKRDAMHDGDMKDKDRMEMKGDSTMKIGNMKDMNMKEKDNMKNMPGMGKIKNRKGVDDMKDMKDNKEMKNMSGMDTMKNMKGMEVMKDMPGMDSTMSKGDMKNMKMPEKNAIDALRFPDNNPALKKSKKPGKQ